MGNADGLQSRPHKGIPLFSREGIPFGICLWSWFMWNSGPVGAGRRCHAPLSAYPSVLQMGSLRPSQAAICLGHATAKPGLGGKCWLQGRPLTL